MVLRSTQKCLVICCLLLWAAMLPTTALRAQTDGPRNVLKINPLSLMIGVVNLKAEHKLNTRFTGQLGLHVGAPRLNVNAPQQRVGIKYFFAGITPELRYYIAFHRVAVPKGLFVGTYCRYIYVKERYHTQGVSPTNTTIVEGTAQLRRQVVGLGFLVGYQFLFKKRVSLDMYIGPQYSSSFTKREFLCTNCTGTEQEIGRPGLRFDGIEPRAGIGIGYAF